MQHIHSLTGLRGLAALLVFISHSANDGFLPVYVGDGFGQTGVMLFFVLSGFLMCHLYACRDFTAEDIRTYALARVGRVFPLYIGLLLVSFVISSFFYSNYFYDYSDPKSLLKALLFIKAKWTFWTIPVEVQFYVVFIAFWGLYRKGVSVLLLIVGFLVLPAILEYLTGIGQKLPVFRYCFSFFIGVYTAILMDKFGGLKRFKPVADLLGLPLFIYLILNTPNARSMLGLHVSENLYESTWLDPWTWFGVYGVFLCAALNARSLAFFNWSPFAFFGGISYGFYLFHRPIVYHFEQYFGNSVIVWVSVFAISVLISWLSLKYFEKPLAARVRHFNRLRLAPV